MNSDASKKQTREERLAEALRANLKRRKAQSRARAEPGPEDQADDAAPRTGEES